MLARSLAPGPARRLLALCVAVAPPLVLAACGGVATERGIDGSQQGPGGGGASEDAGAPPEVSTCAYELSEVVLAPRDAEALDWGDGLSPIAWADGLLYLADSELATAGAEPRIWSVRAWSEASGSFVAQWQLPPENLPTAVVAASGSLFALTDAMHSDHGAGLLQLHPDGSTAFLFEKPYSGLDIDADHPIVEVDTALSMRVVDSALGSAGRPGLAPLTAGPPQVFDFPAELFSWRGDHYVGLDARRGAVPCDDPHCAAPLASIELSGFDPATASTWTIAEDICIAENPGDEQGSTLPEVRAIHRIGIAGDGFVVSDGIAVVHVGFDGRRRALAAVEAPLWAGLAGVVHEDAVYFTGSASAPATWALYRVPVGGGAVEQLFEVETGDYPDRLSIEAVSSDFVYLEVPAAGGGSYWRVAR